MDLPYTKPDAVTPTTQSWDRAWSEDYFNSVIAQVDAFKTSSVEVYMIKCHISDVTWLSANLKARDYVVYPHVWEKIDQNIHGTHTVIPSCNHIIVAISKATEKKPEYWAQLPIDPLQRHGFIIGNICRSIIVGEDNKVINKSQSPVYLSAILAHRYIPKGCKTVLNLCMGVGSDVLGLACAGFDVIGVDNDKTMYDATTTRLMSLKNAVEQAKAKLKDEFNNEDFMLQVSKMDGVGTFGVGAWISLQKLYASQKRGEEDEEYAQGGAIEDHSGGVPLSSSSPSSVVQ
jgi:hypothetical protein